MAIKLPFKKHVIVFGSVIVFIVGVFLTLSYLSATASAEFKAKKMTHDLKRESNQQTTFLMVRLQECAEKYNSKKFNDVHTELAVKFYENPLSIDEADVKPALIECNRLAYQ